MRGFLADLGYHVVAFELGRNVPTPELVNRLRDKLADLRMTDGRQTSIVGWSLGGIYARHIARAAPEWARAVITLGSPFRHLPNEESSVAPLIRAMSAQGRPMQAPILDSDAPLPVPSTSIFSKSDGIVPWRSCLDTAGGAHETLEVIGSHCGLGHHPAALWVIADRLAQPAGHWKPMEIPPQMRPLLRVHPGA
jgi:pimeloyl-ACP methyl ester carboxylesterase